MTAPARGRRLDPDARREEIVAGALRLFAEQPYAAVSTIDGAGALEVPRTRFAPVKTTDDLLVARSDLWELRDDGAMVPHFDGRPPLVSLDKAHFGMLRDFEARFPAGAPSLVACERLRVSGDVRFGAGVVVRGSVAVEHDVVVEVEHGDGRLDLAPLL